MKQGFFVTFEGSEGVGKSTQIRQLAEYLRQQYDVLITREPGGTGLGEKLRELIKYYNGQDSVCNESELLMFGASRAQLMQKVILPHLEKNGIVLCDRFVDSTTVYQGFGRGLDLSFIEKMHHFSMAERWPDLTILLDIPVELSYQRVQQRKGEVGDRIEASGKVFFETVRQGFLKLAKLYPQRFVTINGDNSPEVVFSQVLAIVKQRLEEQKISE